MRTLTRCTLIRAVGGNIMKYTFYLSLLLVLSSCAQSNVQYRSEYSCDNGMTVFAQYQPDKVNLSINGIQKELYQTVSASGAKYATENGLKPDMGLIWWTKGDEATVFDMILDHTVSPDDYKKIAVCKEK